MEIASLKHQRQALSRNTKEIGFDVHQRWKESNSKWKEGFNVDSTNNKQCHRNVAGVSK